MTRPALVAALALAFAACVKPSPETARSSPAEDECFGDRDVLRDAAVRSGNAGAATALRELDARCTKRAAMLLARVLTLRRENPERALELVERALVLASKKSEVANEAARWKALLREDAGMDVNPDDYVETDEPEDEVAIYLEEAADYEAAGDWAGVRESLRSAIGVAPHPEIQERLREVEARCRLEARRRLGEARAYEAAQHVDDAYAAVDRVIELADPDSAEADEAHDILERLDAASNAAANGEDTGVGDLPDDPRPAPLDGSQLERMARAREAEAKQDWITARYLWRQLSEEYASDPQIPVALERAEEQCLAIARRQIIEAKAYEAASNYPEAKRLLAVALRHADGASPERRDAEVLLERIRVQGSPVTPRYDVPPADAPLVALLRAAEVSAQREDWLAAREIYRRALSTNPGDADVASRLDSAHAECIRMARRFISEAKAYEAATNHPEALEAIELALLYADRPMDRENRVAKEIADRLRLSMVDP